MALFGKKKDGDAEVTTEAEAVAAPAGNAFSPEKAERFFEHARTNHQTLNYEYAVQLWLNGLAQDPASMAGLEGFLRSAAAYVDQSGGKPKTKEIARGLQGKGAIAKYQEALLRWGLNPDDPGLNVKAAEAAANLGLSEVTNRLGRRAFGLVQQDRKLGKSKDVYVKLLDIFDKGGAFEMAVEAGQVARSLDPSDGELDARVKTMMAQAAISRGGFEEGGEGGFRRNIRDAARQAELEAEDTLSKTADVKDRLIAAAEAAFEARPDDAPTMEKLGRALVDRGKQQDLLRAMALYNKAYKEHGQFRFRQAAGDIQVRMARNNVRRARAKLEASPADAALAEKVAAMEAQLLDLETSELRLQVENYPTDLPRKFELGKRLAAKGEHNEAIELFQVAEEDSKNRNAVLKSKAESFLALGGWEDAAIETFRQALSGVTDDGSDLALELRYGLATALQEKAERDREEDAAEEADRLYSQIALKKFGYRDVKERREAVRGLLAELRG